MMRPRAGLVTVPTLNCVGVYRSGMAEATHEGDDNQAPYGRVLK